MEEVHELAENDTTEAERGMLGMEELVERRLVLGAAVVARGEEREEGVEVVEVVEEEEEEDVGEGEGARLQEDNAGYRSHEPAKRRWRRGMALTYAYRIILVFWVM